MRLPSFPPGFYKDTTCLVFSPPPKSLEVQKAFQSEGQFFLVLSSFRIKNPYQIIQENQQKSEKDGLIFSFGFKEGNS